MSSEPVIVFEQTTKDGDYSIRVEDRRPDLEKYPGKYKWFISYKGVSLSYRSDHFDPGLLEAFFYSINANCV